MWENGVLTKVRVEDAYLRMKKRSYTCKSHLEGQRDSRAFGDESRRMWFPVSSCLLLLYPDATPNLWDMFLLWKHLNVQFQNTFWKRLLFRSFTSSFLPLSFTLHFLSVFSLLSLASTRSHILLSSILPFPQMFFLLAPHTSANWTLQKVMWHWNDPVCVCVCVCVCLCAGGYFAGSLAVMTDAAHLLVDFTSFIISLLSLWLSSRPATHKLSFGWHRAGNVSSSIRAVAAVNITELHHKRFSKHHVSSWFIRLSPPLHPFRDPWRSAVNLHHLAGNRSVGLPGGGAPHQRRLHHRGHYHARYLWLCGAGQYNVSKPHTQFSLMQLLSVHSGSLSI